MIKLSVIIVNYNVQFFLEQCILSVKAAAQQIDTEIIVVDNNSSDDSCDMIHNKFPEVHLIANLQNVGFSIANNQGVAKAIGEYILILNPDTVIGEDTLEKILDFAEQQDNLGALGVRFIDGSGDFLPECKRNIPTVGIAGKKILGNSTGYYAGQIPEYKNEKVEILCGAFMFMRREVFQKVEGFDEAYFMYGEDVDLSYKLLNKGFDNLYFGSTSIIHYKGESTIKDASNFKYFYGAMDIFYKKYFKINRFYNLISKLVFRSLVLYKSLLVKNKIDDTPLRNKALIIGKDQELLDKLNLSKKYKSAELRQNIEDGSYFDMIIFDNNFISNKEIINKMQDLKNQNISKRIVPRGANFYLGSDSSISHGEVTKF